MTTTMHTPRRTTAELIAAARALQVPAASTRRIPETVPPQTETARPKSETPTTRKRRSKGPAA